MSEFSQKKKQKFTNYLENSNFSEVLSENDANEAYNRFHTIIQSALEHSFPLTRLSRARAKYKVWITTALCKSSKKKSKLYKKWLQTKDHRDETKYKEYKRIFRKVALEADQVQYKEKFDTRTNSVKKTLEKFK